MYFRMKKREVNDFVNEKEQEVRWALSVSQVSLEKANIIGNLFWPLIYLSRIFGHCPLNYKPSKPHRLTRLRIHPAALRLYCLLPIKSRWFLWTMMAVLFFIAFWILFIIECFSDFRVDSQQGLGHQMEVLDHVGSLEFGLGRVSSRGLYVMLQVLYVVYPVLQISEALFSWIESRKFIAFLNASKSFQDHFQRTFPTFSLVAASESLHQFRNFTFLFYVLMPAASMAPLLALGYGEFSVTSIGFSLHNAAIMLEDTKSMLTFKVLAEAFKQIRLAINRNVHWEHINYRKVKAWRHIILAARYQVTTACDFQQQHQVFLLTGSIFLVTGLGFVFLNASFDSPYGTSMKIQLLGFASLSVMKVCAKIFVADLVWQEESRLAQDLAFIGSEFTDAGIQMEIAYIYNLIIGSPSKVIYYGIITLDKRIMLEVCSQVITYQIVLMQFLKA